MEEKDEKYKNSKKNRIFFHRSFTECHSYPLKIEFFIVLIFFTKFNNFCSMPPLLRPFSLNKNIREERIACSFVKNHTIG